MRKHPMRVTCAHPGCQKHGSWEFQTRREAAEHWAHLQKYPYRCDEHTDMDQILSPSKLSSEFSYVSEQRPHGIYWGNFGRLSGPGYKAYAADFPPGTKITISVQVEIPASITHIEVKQ